VLVFVEGEGELGVPQLIEADFMFQRTHRHHGGHFVAGLLAGKNSVHVDALQLILVDWTREGNELFLLIRCVVGVNVKVSIRGDHERKMLDFDVLNLPELDQHVLDGRRSGKVGCDDGCPRRALANDEESGRVKVNRDAVVLDEVDDVRDGRSDLDKFGNRSGGLGVATKDNRAGLRETNLRGARGGGV